MYRALPVNRAIFGMAGSSMVPVVLQLLQRLLLFSSHMTTQKQQCLPRQLKCIFKKVV